MDLDFDPLHSLGFLITDWVEAHCQVPAGVYENEPLVFNGWQLFCTVNHYRVRPDAVYDEYRPLSAWHYRRSLVVGPQKSGKSPWGAGMLLVEGVGPSLFAGWAKGGEVYRCADYGCYCGWTYAYQRGEAMGEPRRKSLLGLLAFAETQTDNVYEPLQTLIRNGPLNELANVREGFIRLPNWGKITPLSRAAKSKLGQPLTGGLADESGLYTAENKVLSTWRTMRRGIAAMQGRTVELTNPWDPTENSAAQQAYESAAPDIFKYYQKPPAHLSYANKRERHQIHVHVYKDSPWVDPAGIDAEAAELIETDPAEAERFFGNRLVQGQGAYVTEEQLATTQVKDRTVPDGARIALGFDGSSSGDWTAIRAETDDGYVFTPTYGVDGLPTWWDPKRWDGRIPRGEVHAAVSDLFARYKVKRMYCDPRDWYTEIESWATLYGDEVVVEWPTNSIQRMYDALNRFWNDLDNQLFHHDAEAQSVIHLLNARKLSKPGDKFILGKPSDHQKIDIAMASILAHEAASDARAEGWEEEDNSIFVFG